MKNYNNARLVSWPVKKEDKYYQTPQDLSGVKAIDLFRDNIVLLMEDGTADGFKLTASHSLVDCGLSTYLRNLKNIERIKTSPIFNRIYTWSSDQECTVHEIENEKIQQQSLGKEIVDILCGDAWSLTDIAVSKDGILKPMPEKNHTLFCSIEQLINKINSNSNKRLTDYKKGYIFAIDYQNEASIIWMDNNGVLNYVQQGTRDGTYINNRYWESNSYELLLPQIISPIDDIVPDDFRPEGKNFLILTNGGIKHLSLLQSKDPELVEESGLYEIEEQAAVKSIKSPAIKITESCVAIFQNGRAVEVTVHPLSDYKTNWRDRFKKKSISNEKYIVLDARIKESTVFAIVGDIE